MLESTVPTRRGFLAGCAVAGASLVVAGTADRRAHAEEGPGASGSAEDAQYGFLVDMTRCVGCELCVAACRDANRLSDDTPNRRNVEVFLDPSRMNVYVSTACNHCADPNCLRVCPAGAISKGAAGIVAVDKGRCIGCKYCYQACPYGVPNYNDEAMDKCDCCLGAGVAPGEEPWCVRACKFGALEYGLLDELRARAVERGAEAVPVGEPCGPSCLLIGERG